MSGSVTSHRADPASTLEELNPVISALSMRAGWNKHEPSLWSAPRTAFRPTVWRWAEARAALETAGQLISTEQTERRNLFLVNPLENNHYATLRTLVSAYQMILPGERARSHRHTPNALRLILEAEDDVYTVVDGKRIDMRAGDVVLTPDWCWHGHANDGGGAAYWLDVLDVPLVHLLEPMFFENWPEGFQTPDETVTESPHRFDWSTTERRLGDAVPDEDGRHGRRVELGAPAMPTIGLHMEQLDSGMTTRTARTTANQLFCVVSGGGRTFVDGREFTWDRGDVIVVPSWHSFHHRADRETILFRASDEPVLNALGFLRSAFE